MHRAVPLAVVAPISLLLGCASAPASRQSGKALFDANCSKCHSLIGNESLRRQGGDLVGYRIGHRELRQFVREMPVRHPLNPTQIAMIVGYVSVHERSPTGN